MAYPFPNLNCLLAQILVVSEHGTECTRGNREYFSPVSTPPYPVGMENRSGDLEVVSSLGKHGTSADQDGDRRRFYHLFLEVFSEDEHAHLGEKKPSSRNGVSHILALLKRMLAMVHHCWSHEPDRLCQSLSKKRVTRRFSKAKWSQMLKASLMMQVSRAPSTT